MEVYQMKMQASEKRSSLFFRNLSVEGNKFYEIDWHLVEKRCKMLDILTT